MFITMYHVNWVYVEETQIPQVALKNTTRSSANIAIRWVGQLDKRTWILLTRSSDALANSSARKRDIAPQDANDALDSFYIDLLGFRTLLKQLGADKGLLNYDPTNHMETLLKDDINLVKDTLTSVYKIVANIPVLGPRKSGRSLKLGGTNYGAVVYDIKCIVDEVLDAVENITDGILNSLPQLKDILNQIASLLGA